MGLVLSEGEDCRVKTKTQVKHYKRKTNKGVKPWEVDDRTTLFQSAAVAAAKRRLFCMPWSHTLLAFFKKKFCYSFII